MISLVNQVANSLLNRLTRRPTDALRASPQSAERVGALGYLVHGQIERGLIPIHDLTLVVLYGGAMEPGRWLAGYTAERVPWGVAWGGAKRHRFLKDLALPPKLGARAARLDLKQAPMLELAFQLSQLIEQYRAQRLPTVQNRIELPRLWAGFERTIAGRLKGAGPELSARCRRRKRCARALLRSSRRSHHGLVLFPLDWVSHHWRNIASVFADVGRFRKRQVFRLAEPSQDLVGYRGAAEFDFYHSRFRRDDF
jgi:hypothetical protein